MSAVRTIMWLVAISIAGCATRESWSHDASTLDAAETPLDADAADVEGRCVREQFPARPVPLELMVLVNRDLGLAWPRYDPPWFAIRDALNQFSDSRDTPDLSLGLQFVPHPTAVEQCDPTSYDAPYVPLTPVPEVAATFRTTFDTTALGGEQSSVRPALEATYRYLRARKQVRPHAQHAVLLVMASADSGFCFSYVDVVANMAAVALKDDGIFTFTFGVKDASPEGLDPVAKAGGTVPSYTGDTLPSWLPLVTSLKEARLQATACDLLLPESQNGWVDPARVALRFREDADRPELDWPLRANLAACAGGLDGFYYDDPAAPEVLKLCPASCEIARSHAGKASLRVAADCVQVLY